MTVMSATYLRAYRLILHTCFSLSQCFFTLFTLSFADLYRSLPEAKETKITTIASGPADTSGANINSLNQAVAALRTSCEATNKATQQVLSQLDSMIGYYDIAVQTAKDFTMKTEF